MFSKIIHIKLPWNLLVVFLMNLISCDLMAQILYSNSRIPLDAYSNIGDGNQISDASINQSVFFKNPALLDSSTAGALNIVYQRQISINLVSLAYQLKKYRKFNTSFFFSSNAHSNFIETDQLGNVIGNYGISASQLGVFVSKSQGNYKLGFSNRLVINNLAGILQFGNYFDFGGQFIHPVKDLKFAFSLNNIKINLKKNLYYYSFQPLDLNLGASLKPKYMPVRIHGGLVRQMVLNYDKMRWPVSDLSRFKGLIQTDILIHRAMSLLVGLNLFSDLNGSVNTSIAYGMAFKKENLGFSVSNRKELGLYNILSFSLYIATK